MEISNPGEPIVLAERFIDGYQSRNEHRADLMRRMRICEEKGSGVDKVVPGRRRVKEQLKKMGSFEYYQTSFSYTLQETGEETSRSKSR